MNLFSATAIALVFSSAAYAQKPSINVCTGPEGGNYQKAVFEVLKQAKERMDVKPIDSKGSIDSLDKLASGACDIAPIQNDAMKVYKQKYAKDAGNLEKAGTLYKEYVHLVCNRKSGIGRVTDLMGNKYRIAIGPGGSGSSVTWDSFILADKRYGEAPTVPLAGLRALEKVKMGDEVACMIFTAALNSAFVTTNMSEAGDYVHLIKANDGDFDTAKDERGVSIYTYDTIPTKTYPKLQDGSVRTVVVDALWVARGQFIDEKEKLYNWFLEAKNKASPEIRKMVGQ